MVVTAVIQHRKSLTEKDCLGVWFQSESIMAERHPVFGTGSREITSPTTSRSRERENWKWGKTIDQHSLSPVAHFLHKAHLLKVP